MNQLFGSENSDSDEQQLINDQRDQQARNYGLSFLVITCVIGASERWAYFQYMADIGTLVTQRNSSYCGMYTNSNKTLPSVLQVQSDSIVHAIAFIMPLVGGALADRLIGRLKTVQLSSVLYLIAAVLIVVLVYVPNACTNSWYSLNALQTPAHVLIASGAGLIKPSLLVLTIEAAKEQGWSMDTGCLIYYLFLAIGQTCGYVCALVGNLLKFPFVFAIATVAVVKFVSSISYRCYERKSRVKYRGIPRVIIIEYLHIATVYVPVCWAITLSCYTLAGFELTHYLANYESYVQWIKIRTNTDIMITINSVGILVTVIILLLVNARFAPLNPIVRTTIGIAVAAIAQMLAFFANIFNNTFHHLSSGYTYTMYGTLSFAHGVTEALTIATVNEMSYRIAQPWCKTIVSGLYIAVWSSGFTFSMLSQLIFSKSIQSNTHPPTWILYLIVFLLLLFALFQLQFRASDIYYDLCDVIANDNNNDNANDDADEVRQDCDYQSIDRVNV